ncbi:hypothetical protein EST38_g11692 [Candolleomyces aberdarensis]|uniref:RNA-directed DNA polymerase n=1 Tax=Candolleomyces aberdarensis TaxID=2316362 RepID=A0A4V1Q281_9AGAR|nr:hypothetical protein EST38_g11692 [Candolleomyces aberdarensis]
MDPIVIQQEPLLTLKTLPEISSGFSSLLTPLSTSTRASAPEPNSTSSGGDITAGLGITSVSGTDIASNAHPVVVVAPSGPSTQDLAIPLIRNNPSSTSPVDSDSDSDSDEPSNTIVITSRTQMSSDKVYCQLTVTEGHTKPPSLGIGRLGRDVGVEFCDACEAYFLTKEVPDDKKVVKILTCFKDFKHKQWIKLNRVDLVKKTWEEFIEEFLGRWMEKHWDMNLSDKLRTFSQGTAHFYEWAQDYRAQAAHLAGTPYEMYEKDEKHVRAQISALMVPRLRLHTKADPKFTNITDFHDWLDAVNDEFELYTEDLKAAAEYLRAQDVHPSKKQKTSHAAPTPASASGSTSKAPTQALTDGDTNRKRCPKLTEAERTLLEDNKGCFNCREFFVTHRRNVCTNWPEAAGYKPLTQADVDAARSKLAASVPTKAIAAASIAEVNEGDRSVEVHTVAATMGRMVKFNGALDGYQSEDSYVSPLSCPTLPWSAVAFGHDDDFPLPVSALLDCGSQLILISEPCCACLGLKLQKLKRPFRLELALPSSPDCVSSASLFSHFVRLSLSSSDNGWTSRTFDAVVAPSLVEGKDFILGTPFLTSNNVVIDFGNMTAIPSSSGFDLLRPGAPVVTPPAKPARMTAHEQRQVTRNLSLAMRELRVELRKVPRPEDMPTLAPACGYAFDHVVFAPPDAPVPAYALHTVDLDDDIVLINRFDVNLAELPTERVVSDESSPWLGPRTSATIAALTERIKSGVSSITCQDIDRFVREEYGDIFGVLPPVHELPTDDLCRIPLIDATKSIESRSYSSPRKYREAWSTIINDHLSAGRIRPSDSHHASPSFLIPKADPAALPRWVIDYWQLNRNVRLDKTPLPGVDDILADAAKGKYWAKFDTTNSFFQTRMHPDDIPLMATSTPLGLFEWTVMPMGFKNSPQIHQRRMRRALAQYIGKFCHVYLDDIIVWSSSLREHRRNLQLILNAIRAHKLFLNAKKSVFCSTEIKFLGHVIGRDGIKPDGSKVDRIHRWPVPSSAKDVRRFLGLVRYLDPFLPQLARHAEVLTRLTTKDCDKVFPVWTPAHQRAFDSIKGLVTSADCLTTIDHASPGENNIYVTCDASEIGTGAVLSFGPSWEAARPVAFYSKSLKDAEAHYPTHDKEMLAIVRALRKWRADLIGTPFYIYTDHRTLEYFDTQRDLSSQQLRWNEFLSDYKGKIVYIRGKDNTVADALSRVSYVDDSATADAQAPPLLESGSAPSRVCMLVDRTVELYVKQALDPALVH